MSYPSSLVYKPSAPNELASETIFGTPVPVAHSTASHNNHGKSQKAPLPSPTFNRTFCVRRGEGLMYPYSDSYLNEGSILNLDKMKDLTNQQGIEQTHVKHGYTITSCAEEDEAEVQAVRFDDVELQVLEEAFSSLDFEASETTIATRACALSNNDPHNLQEGKQIIGDDTISSLHSEIDNSATEFVPSTSLGEQKWSDKKECNTTNAQPKTVPSLEAVSKVESVPNVVESIMNSTLLERSVQSVSCLHMSDIDNLLDVISSNRHADQLEFRSNKTSKAVIDRLDDRTVAVQRALRLQHNQLTKELQTDAKWTTENVSTEKVQVAIAKPDAICGLTCHPLIPVPGRASLTEFGNPSSVTNKMEVSDTQLKIHTDSPSLLSNTNCLIWCSAACEQTHRKHFLIKHHMNKAITITFQIFGSDVFKLSDEKGHLITTSHTIQLPPNLSFTVHVAYMPQHSLCWDIGYLQIQLKKPESSVWKVRLVGYSSSSQLECSCCTRLGSDTYWTKASVVKEPTSVTANLLNYVKNQNMVNVDNYSINSLASVGLNNYGCRAAWVYTHVECLDSVNKKQPCSSSDILVEPKFMVIGSKQSQNIVITLKSTVKAAHIVFFYGDEVLRREYRLFYKSSTGNNRVQPDISIHRRRRVKLVDLMQQFFNEQSIQIAEIPSCTSLRPKYWRQAFIQQLRTCAHINLSVYTNHEKEIWRHNFQSQCDTISILSSMSDSTKENYNASALASLLVKEDAFKDCASPTVSSTVYCNNASLNNYNKNARDVSLNNNHNLVGTTRSLHYKRSQLFTPKLKIVSADTLTFHLSQKSPIIRDFIVQFEQADPTSTIIHPHWQIFWWATPITKVCNILRPCVDLDVDNTQIIEDSVFICLNSKHEQANHGVIQLSIDRKRSSDISFPITFKFCKPDTFLTDPVCLLKQNWEITTVLRPMLKTNSSFKSKITEHHESFHVVLEAVFTPSYHLRANPENSLTTSKKRTLLQIDGLPVKFDPIISTSDVHFSEHQIELFNPTSGDVFVKLQLPQHPFHLVSPNEIRFRIASNARMSLLLRFYPSTCGTANSHLGIHTRSIKLTGDGDSSSLTGETNFKIPLFGTMH